MSHLIPNSFSSFSLTDEEALQGGTLTITQKQVIQSQLATVAEEKLALEFDPEHSAKFTQQEAYKRGQMDILTFILDNSTACEEALQNPQAS